MHNNSICIPVSIDQLAMQYETPPYMEVFTEHPDRSSLDAWKKTRVREAARILVNGVNTDA